MKKGLILVLVLCTVLTSAFATMDEMAVGLRGGFDSLGGKYSTIVTTNKMIYSGAYVAGTFDATLSDGLGVTANLGLTFGKPTIKMKAGDGEWSSLKMDYSLLTFSLFAAPKYAMEVADGIVVDAAAGLYFSYTTLADDVEDEGVICLGAGAEAKASYEVADSITVFGGAGYNFVFYNSTFKDLETKHSTGDFKVFAGASYSL